MAKNIRETEIFFITIIKVLKLVWDVSKTYTFALSILTLIQSLFPISHAWIGKLIIDTVIQAIDSGNTQLISKVMFLIGLQFILTVLSSLLNYFNTWISERLSDLFTNHIDVQIIKKAINLDLSFYENPAFYDKLRNAESGTAHRPIALVREIFRLIQNIVSLIPFVILIFNFNWIILVVLTATVLPYIIVQSGNVYLRYVLIRDRAPEARQLNYLKYLLTSDYSVKEVKLFNLSSYLLKQYVEIFGKFYNQNRYLSWRKNLSGFLLESISSLGLVGSYAYIVYRTILGFLTIGDLTLYLQALNQSQNNTLGT